MDFSDIEARGYIPGGGMLSPTGVFYLNIPKNASTFLTNVLAENGWEYHVLGDHGSNLIKQFIVVLRDPIDRWISGFGTYAALYILNSHYGSDHYLKDYNVLTEKFIFDTLIFDDHTTPQSKFVAQLPADKPITYFKLTEKLIPQMGRHTGRPIIVNDVDDNASDSNYDQKQISAFMRDRINNDPLRKAQLIERYKSDFNLITSVQFYYDPL